MKLERICYMTLIFALGILCFYQWKCTGRKPCPAIVERNDTTVTERKDTARTETPLAVSKNKGGPKYKFQKYTDGILFRVDSGYLVLDSTLREPTDSLEVWNDYYDLKGYSYKYEFPEGDIIVENQVYKNSLQDQKIFPTFRKTEITKTLVQTDTIYQPQKRTIAFIGGGLYGNKNSIINGGIFDFSLKDKRDKIYSAGRIQSFNGQGGYWFGKLALPIRLIKNKN